MNKKNNVLKIYKQKIKNLKKHNKYYFIDDDPKISDDEYDKIKREIIELEKNHSFLINENLSKSLIGAPPSNKFQKIKHLRPMLSLSNAFEISDMKDYLKKINNYLNLKNKEIELFCEPKIDGIYATLIYEKGTLIKVYLEAMELLEKIF